jgi:hypothetical protein
MSLFSFFSSHDQPVDALELMQQDHRRFLTLFDQLHETTRRGESVRTRLFASLKRQLVAHEFMEEQVIYPALRQHSAAKDLILESLQEHHAADLLVQELTRLPVSSEAWGPKCHVLGEGIKHHIHEEEQKMFVQARALLGTKELLRLGAIMARKRQQRLDAQQARSQEGRRQSNPAHPAKGPRSAQARAGRPAQRRRLARSR